MVTYYITMPIKASYYSHWFRIYCITIIIVVKCNDDITVLKAMTIILI